MSLSRYQFGVLNLGKIMYRYVIYPPSKEGFVITVTDPSLKLKWHTTSQISEEVLKAQFRGETISYKFVSGRNMLNMGESRATYQSGCTNLALKVGRDWIILLFEEYTYTEFILEELIQNDKYVEPSPKIIGERFEDVTKKFGVLDVKIKEMTSANESQLGELQSQLKQVTGQLKEVITEVEGLVNKVVDIEKIQKKDNLDLTNFKANVEAKFKEFEERISNRWGPHLRVSSANAIGQGGYVAWEITDFNSGWFTVAGDRITVLQTGVYLVSFHVAAPTATNAYYMSLYLSGADVVRFRESCNHSYIKTNSVTQVLSVNAGQYIQVYNHSGVNTVASQPATKLSIVALFSGWSSVSLPSIRISSNIACAYNQCINWNNVYHNSGGYVTGQNITVPQASFCLVSFQANSTNNGNADFLDVQINGVTNSRCYATSGGSYQHTFHLVGVLQIPAGGQVSVRNMSASNIATIASHQEQMISLIHLSDLQSPNHGILSLSNNTLCTNGNVVQWDHAHITSPQLYTFQPGTSNVTFQKAGVYLVSVFVTGRNTTNGGIPISLRINNVVVSSCYWADGYSYVSTRCLTEVVNINVNDRLEIVSAWSNSSYVDPLSNKLSIVKLMIN